MHSFSVTSARAPSKRFITKKYGDTKQFEHSKKTLKAVLKRGK